MAGFRLVLDTSKMEKSLKSVIQGMPGFIEQSLGDVMDKWKAEAVNIALMEKATLRRGISVEVSEAGGSFTGLIKSVAKERGFDYAYYWHEIRGAVNNPTTAGTVAKYLDESASKNIDKWHTQFANDFEVYISKLGG